MNFDPRWMNTFDIENPKTTFSTFDALIKSQHNAKGLLLSKVYLTNRYVVQSYFSHIFTKTLWTDQRTDGRTNRPSYRDARTHIKTVTKDGCRLSVYVLLHEVRRKDASIGQIHL